MTPQDTLLHILQCPDSGQALEPLDEAQLGTLNARILEGGLTTRGGRPITKAVTGALITLDRRALYLASPFPQLLPEDAIDPAHTGL